jgi:putative endonuclease
MAYYTYILRCEDASLYTGITTDLVRRFAEHSGQCGKSAKYTASRRPVRYEAAWESPDRAHALKLECRSRGLPNRKRND